MKIVFLFIVGLTGFYWYLSDKAGPGKIGTVKADTINFTTQIQPILQKKCAPCHFPGGQLYEKMPFDKGATIIAHERGMYKRITDKNEQAVFKKYIQQHTASK